MPPAVLVFLVLNAAVLDLWLALGQSPFMLDNFPVSWDALTFTRRGEEGV